MGKAIEDCQTTREVIDWQGGAFTERQIEVILRLISLARKEPVLLWDEQL